MGKEKILITSALPYVNGIPHLGHLAGCLLPSDVYARFNRAIGNEVLYICGTDEHGSVSELGAKKEGMNVAEYTTKYHNLHKQAYNDFCLSFDFFGRTSSKENIELTSQIATELYKNGYIYEKELEQLYSVDDGMFLSDRYVIGTCPFCGAENARGDQCESCTKLLNPTDLVNPKSAISGSSNLELRKTKHLYLKLSALSSKVEEWIKTRNWNKLTIGIANKWLKEGLNDRCITRDIDWGVKVPDTIPGMQGKVFYVWFDAPIGYISITKEFLGDDYTKWWLNSCGADKVKYVEFMGKDSVPFHSVMFPATLIGASDDYKKVDELKGLSYLNYNGGKFSKSAGRGVFVLDAISLFPVDFWRYWLLKNMPETDDTDFSFERFAEEINKDLNDVLGNFILRVLKFYKSKFDTIILHDLILTDKENDTIKNLQQKLDNYTEALKNLEFRKAIAELRAMWVIGNEYIDETAPWSVYKTDTKRAGEILMFAINLVYIYMILSKPVIPMTADKILSCFGVDGEWIFDIQQAVNTIKKGATFIVPDTIFFKITDDKVAELNEKYGK